MPQTDEPAPSLLGHSWILVLPAIASWACALILLGCSPTVSAIISLLTTLGALATALHAHTHPPGHARTHPLGHARTHPLGNTPSHPPGHAHVRPPTKTPSHPPGQARVWRGVFALRMWRNAVIAVLACSAATSATVAFRVHAVTTGPVADLAARNTTISAELEITDDPKPRPAQGMFTRESIVVAATLLNIQTGRVRLAVRSPVVLFGTGREWRTLLPSQRISVTARLAPADPGNLVAAVLLVRGPPRVLTGPSTIQSAAGELRAGLRKAADVLPPDQRGLLPGLVVGDVSRMDPHVSADLKEAGLSHLNAVSGANLAIVAGAVLAISRTAGLPLAARAVIAALAMLAFAVVARPSPSVLRALLMGLTAVAALGTGRPRDGVAALSCSVLLLILFDPELARSYGFALSVCATAGILLLAPGWRDRMAVRMPRWAAEAIAVPAAAQAAVTPILVLMSGQLTFVAIPANLLAGPAVAPATLLGFAATVVAPLWPEAAQLLVLPAGYAVGWIIVVARHAVQLPFATAPWPGGLPGLALLAVAVAVAVPLLRRASLRWIVLTVTVAGLVGVLAVGPAVRSWPPPRWLMVTCDVGQGDALVVAAGPGRAVVVDTGPDPVAMDRCLQDLGIKEIPLLVLTHAHADHTAGLSGAARGRRIGTILTSPRHTPTPTPPLPTRLSPPPQTLPSTRALAPTSPATSRPATSRPATSRPASSRPASSRPASSRPAPSRPVSSNHASSRSATSRRHTAPDARATTPAKHTAIKQVASRHAAPARRPTHLTLARGLALADSQHAPARAAAHLPLADPTRAHPALANRALVHRRLVAASQTPAAPRDVLAGDFASMRSAFGSGVEWRVAVPGDRWVVGPSEITVLGPQGSGPTDRGPGEGSVLNNSSVVVMVRWRAGSALLSGDIETEAQAELLRTVAPRADILKVPHHGSARQDPAFLAAIGARAALISVGADNGYGHPAPVTLAALHRFGARIYRTDQSGDLAVIDQNGRLALIARGKTS